MGVIHHHVVVVGNTQIPNILLKFLHGWQHVREGSAFISAIINVKELGLSTQERAAGPPLTCSANGAVPQHRLTPLI